MVHAGPARLSVPILILPLLLLGAPALAHPADADVTCTAAAVARTSAGLTMAESADVQVTVEPTTASCVDKRTLRAGDKIAGAVITVPKPGRAKGTCGELTVTGKATVAWIKADGSEAEASELEATLEIDGTELKAEAELSGGELDGYQVSGDLANRSELQQHLTSACATEEGATTAVAQLTLGFTKNPWGR